MSKGLSGNQTNERMSEEGIDPTNEYHSSSPSPKRVFSFDWSSGFVAPFVPTREEIVERALTEIHLEPTDVLCDLGSGDGRFVMSAARRGARAVGVELDPKLVEISRRKAESAGGLRDLVEFRVGDLQTIDITPFTVVVAFLFPEVIVRLRPRLESWLVSSSSSSSNRHLLLRRRLICVRWPLSENDSEWNRSHLAGDISTFSSMGFFVYH